MIETALACDLWSAGDHQLDTRYTAVAPAFVPRLDQLLAGSWQ